jgi:hypothetical protein
MKDARRALPLPPTDLLTVAVATGIVFFLLAYGGKLVEAYRLQRHNATLQAEITALEEEQRELQEKLVYVQSPAYAEQVAREQFKWAAPQDNLVITTYRYGTLPSGGDVGRGSASGEPNGSGLSMPGWLSQLLSLFD